MGLIHVLDTEVSNKIAAGEVVEKPLSIVKELVENSIDAGASLITVEIRNGGISYIRVTDNGSGMSEEDAKICFLRHATSKIQTGGDLEAIYTLGFRGEALSSIGAVSRVKLYTKRRMDEIGVCVTCEGGEILSSADAGAPNGTVIEVSDLFYNTPARLKFLKKPATEGGYIADLMARYVFAHPEISFKLIREGKETVFSAGDNKLINAIYSVYGRDFAKSMLEVDYQYNDIHVAGMIGKGTLSRANRNNETFFVNKRYIKSAILIHALEEAYKNQIMISKFPTAILNIEIAATDVDINVHPTKLECKFSNESEIYQAVYHAVKSALYELPNVPEIERTEKKEQEEYIKANVGEQKTLEELYGKKLRESMKPSNDFKFKTQHRESPRPSWDEIKKPEPQRAELRDTSAAKPAIPAENDEAAAFEKLMNRAKAAENTDIPSAAKAKPAAAEEMPQIQTETGKRPVDTFAMLDYALELGKKKGRFTKVRDSESAETTEADNSIPDWREYRDRKNEEYAQMQEENIFNDGYFRVIGQLFETYILVEKDDKLLMIDQHAAHERLNFEALKQELESSGIASQMMLEPVEIRLSGEEFAVYTEHEKDFFALGFEIADDGESNVTISAVPGDISWSEVEPLFLELLTLAGNMSQQLLSYDKERLLYTISCKAAIKANMEISELEMQSLVERVFKLKNINTCPHGRPIVICISKKEIEKNFKRIV